MKVSGKCPSTDIKENMMGGMGKMSGDTIAASCGFTEIWQSKSDVKAI